MKLFKLWKQTYLEIGTHNPAGFRLGVWSKPGAFKYVHAGYHYIGYINFSK